MLICAYVSYSILLQVYPAEGLTLGALKDQATSTHSIVM